MRRIILPAGLLAIGALLIAAAITLPRADPQEFHGTFLAGEIPPADFTLESAAGSVSLSDLRGRVALVFFGYTSCPDVCPLTMARLRRVMDLLGERRGDVRVVFVSVDPEVDSPEMTLSYVRSFDGDFIGLTGSASSVREAARSFGVYIGDAEAGSAAQDTGAEGAHEGHAEPDAPQRLVAHSPHVFGLDRDGARRLIWDQEATAAEIAADVRSLLRL